VLAPFLIHYKEKKSAGEDIYFSFLDSKVGNGTKS
jgi:hypothetical protein